MIRHNFTKNDCLIFKAKLFNKVVRIYRENWYEYQKLLKEVRVMIENKKSNADNFFQYLSEKLPSYKISELRTYYSDIDTFCNKIGVLKKPLFETTDFEIIKKVQRTIEQNKIFKITRRKHHAKIVDACRHYYDYVRDGRFESVEISPISEKNLQSDYRPDNTVKVESISENLNTDSQTDFVSASTKSVSVTAMSLEEKLQDALRKETEENPYGTTVSYLRRKIQCGDSLKIKDILDNAKWAKLQYGRYFYVEENTKANTTEVIKPKIKTTEPNVEEKLCVDFNGVNDFAYTKPEYFTYFGERKNCDSTWTDLYVTFVATVYEDYPHIFKPRMTFSHKRGRIELATNTDYSFMIAPKPVYGTNLMLETNIGANAIVSKIKFILDLCNVDYENVEIIYRKRSVFAKLEKNTFRASGCDTNEIFTFERPPVKEVTAPKQQINEQERAFISEMEQIILRADIDGMSYDALKDNLRITMVLTKQLVAKSTKIVDIKGILIHEDAFVDWEDGAENLNTIIEKLMKKNNGYISSIQLFNYAQIEMNMFLNDNDMREERAVYDMAQHLFEKVHYNGKSYVFKGKTHISRADAGIDTNMDIYKKYATDQGGIFNLNGLVEYLERIGIGTGNLRNQMRMWIEPFFFLYNDNVIVTSEALGINEDWKKNIKKSLDDLFDDAGDHFILRNIPSIWFDRLPAISGNHPWTPLLLQGILRFYSNELGARTIQALEGQSLETLHTMLVANDSHIQNFGDVVISYLLEQNIERRKFEAEELRLLLVDGGILHGNELILNMPKALKCDERFAWDLTGNNVTINI